MENIRTRCYGLILYKDSTEYNYDEVISYIEKNIEKYAYIEHKAEEEDKKPHTHIILYFNNKRWLSSLSQELGVSSNYFQEVKLKPYLKYLIHFDNEEKIQYSIDEVKGPLRYLLIDLISNKTTEQEDFVLIYDFITTYDGKLSFTEIVKFCMKNNFYSCFRRNVNAIRILINEHNGTY